jgi:hypothetical protein
VRRVDVYIHQMAIGLDSASSLIVAGGRRTARRRKHAAVRDGIIGPCLNSKVLLVDGGVRRSVLFSVPNKAQVAKPGL